MAKGAANTIHGQVASALKHVEAAEKFTDDAAIVVADRMTDVLSGARFEQSFIARLNENLEGANVEASGISTCDFSETEALLEKAKKPGLPPVKIKFLPAA